MVQNASGYTITSFDVPGAGFGGTQGLAINSTGEAAGVWYDSNSLAHVFVEYNGTITNLDVPDSPSFIFAGNVFINNAGEVVGNDDNNNGLNGFIENHGSVSTFFPGFAAGESWIDGINNKGEVLGAYLDNNFNEHDVIVEKDGRVTNLSLPAGTSLLFGNGAINDAGSFAVALSNGQVLIDHAGKITTFAAPGAGQLYINDAGEVAGTDGFSSGFLYDKGTVTHIPGFIYGLNNAGQVIGNIDNREGFVYSDGTLTPIIPPGSNNSSPFGINNSGEITGSWFDSNGNRHGFIATPTGDSSGVPLSQLFGSVPAPDLLPPSRTTASSPWAAQLHSASATALGALTYSDASTVVIPDLHGDGGGH